MTSDARFGIEFVDPGARQVVDGATASVVGHVWSADAAHIVVFADGSVHVVDPGGANPVLLNGSMAALNAFLAEFEAFYAVERPPVARPMTKDEARAKLARLQRGESEPAAVPFVKPSRERRLPALEHTLGRIDPVALRQDTWWSRILQQLDSGRI